MKDLNTTDATYKIILSATQNAYQNTMIFACKQDAADQAAAEADDLKKKLLVDDYFNITSDKSEEDINQEIQEQEKEAEAGLTKPSDKSQD